MSVDTPEPEEDPRVELGDERAEELGEQPEEETDDETDIEQDQEQSGSHRFQMKQIEQIHEESTHEDLLRCREIEELFQHRVFSVRYGKIDYNLWAVGCHTMVERTLMWLDTFDSEMRLADEEQTPFDYIKMVRDVLRKVRIHVGELGEEVSV